ncbi:MAG TPA: endonuclease/exonuclease/phosphatase family protein, partial [Candidatus Saccharimonadales bacterium]
TKRPLIIAGDFNLNSDSQPINTFKNSLNLSDLTEDYNLDNTLVNEVTPYKVDCDHVFVSQDINIHSYKMSDKLLSDHRALSVEFDLS